MGKKTPLYNKHLEKNAKMVDFGGWDMPLHYGSQINEHHQVRRDAGVFDVSHMTVIDLNGQRVREFLRYLLANDVGRLKKTGKALYSCMLNEQGGVIDDLIVYFQEETQFRLVVNAATHDKDIAWITQQAKAFAIQIRERDDLAMLAVQGPQTREKVKPLLPGNLQTSAMALAPFHASWNNDEIFVARTGYTGEEGFEMILPAQHAPDWWDALLAAGVLPVGLAARDTLRLEAGMNLYGADMDENYSPLESGLGWTVAFKPEDRDFIGRSALQAQKNQRTHQIMVGLVLREKGVLRAHQTVSVEGGGEGHITSGTFSPTCGFSIAFARLPAGVHEQATVTIRNKQLPAQVVKPPFVRHGKTCIDL
ncbi:MAG: glycine cleavage system aminomethyltransferase GcvT [Candidatus Parabeggiatoa sp. nov. 1]|nr:MAG: glycine cleavage system aminomethyltransferase GcvT [Gammaproteobacteria bacterium]